MSGWTVTYLFHGAAWAVLMALALVIKPIAQAPIPVMFLIAGLPYFIGMTLGLSGTSSSMRVLYAIYLALLIVLGWIFLASAGQRLANGKPTLARLIPHVGIATIGFFALLFVGSINFPFVL